MKKLVLILILMSVAWPSFAASGASGGESNKASAFKAAENEYGSIENYIRSGLNISEKEIQQLRSFLLET